MLLLYTICPYYSLQTTDTSVEYAHKTNDRCNQMDIDTGYCICEFGQNEEYEGRWKKQKTISLSQMSGYLF